MIVLRRAALLAALIGGAGSVGFLLRAGQRPSLLLLGIMLIWVLAPFLALSVAGTVAKRWTLTVRATLYFVMLFVTVGALAVYLDDALRPRQAQAAYVFVMVPLVSWALIAITISIAALLSRSRASK